jgi:hypothetical protein
VVKPKAPSLFVARQQFSGRSLFRRQVQATEPELEGANFLVCNHAACTSASTSSVSPSVTNAANLIDFETPLAWGMPPALSGEMRASLNGRGLVQRRDRAQWEGLLAWRASVMVAVTSLYILVAIAAAVAFL